MTLVEVMLALAILTLVAGMVIGLTRAVVGVAEEVELMTKVGREEDALDKVMSAALRALPRTSEIWMEPGKGPDESPWLVISKSPGVLGVGANTGAAGDLWIGLRKGERAGGEVLGWERRYHDPVAGTDKITQPWLGVLDDMRMEGWRFFDKRSGRWETEWTDKSVRPGAIELKFRRAGSSEERRWVWWVPLVERATP
jgi:type II secretory pathway pseudopilin PulG